MGSLPFPESDVGESAASGAEFQFLQFCGAQVGGFHDAPVFHEVGQLEGLSAPSGAGVPPLLSGAWGADEAHGLGGQVLDFEASLPESLGSPEVCAGVPEADAREALRLAAQKLPCNWKVVSKADLEGGVN